MLYRLERKGQPTKYYWQSGAGPARQLGEAAEITAIWEAIDIWLHSPWSIPELIAPPPEEPEFFSVPEAVSAAITFEIVNGLNTSKRRLTDSIRSAARRGSIAGAYRTAEGYWRLPVAAFNAWLAEHAEQKRGRPRKEAAPVIITRDTSLDTYTVELWRNRISGDQYAIKRDSTGIVVGACGPFPVDAGDVHIGDVD